MQFTRRWREPVLLGGRSGVHVQIVEGLSWGHKVKAKALATPAAKLLNVFIQHPVIGSILGSSTSKAMALPYIINHMYIWPPWPIYSIFCRVNGPSPSSRWAVQVNGSEHVHSILCIFSLYVCLLRVYIPFLCMSPSCVRVCPLRVCPLSSFRVYVLSVCMSPPCICPLRAYVFSVCIFLLCDIYACFMCMSPPHIHPLYICMSKKDF